MFHIRVTGEAREATFELDAKEKTFKRIDREIKNNGIPCDYLTIKMQDLDTSRTYTDAWVLLHGTAESITEAIDTKLEIAKLGSNELFEYLNANAGTSETVFTICYCVEDPSVIVTLPKFQLLRAVRKNIISSMFNIPMEDIAVLEIKNPIVY